MKKALYQPMECPVCGKFYFSELQEGDEISRLQCSKCGWHYDYDQTVDSNLKSGKEIYHLSPAIAEGMEQTARIVEIAPDPLAALHQLVHPLVFRQSQKIRSLCIIP